MRSAIIVIIILVLAGIAVGFGAQYLSTQEHNILAQSEDQKDPMLADSADDSVVLAKVGPYLITEKELNESFTIDPAQLQGVDIKQLYPALVEQLINQKLIDAAAGDAIKDNNAELKEAMKTARTEIKRNIYLQQIIEGAVTDEELALAYAEYVQNVPAEQEVHARHILVKDEQTAQDLIAKLNNGEDFVALAQEYSEGPTGKTGGDLGFFKKNQMVAPFAEAAFSTEAGTVMQKPVQTQFGWHVIEVLEKRDAKPATFEQAKESLVNALRQKALAEHMQALKGQYDIIKYYEQAAEEARADDNSDAVTGTSDDIQDTKGEAAAE